VSSFGGNVVKNVLSTSACSAGVRFNPDGTCTGTQSGPAGTFTDQATGDRWFSGTPPAGYLVVATLTLGSAPTTGTLNAEVALSGSPVWSYNSGTGGSSSTRSGTIRFDIRATSGGATVASGSYFIEASRDS
jgi:hypothetical protein